MNPYREEQKQRKRDDLLARCKALLSQGRRVDAVKLYRNEVGCTLVQAMNALKEVS